MNTTAKNHQQYEAAKLQPTTQRCSQGFILFPLSLLHLHSLHSWIKNTRIILIMLFSKTEDYLSVTLVKYINLTAYSKLVDWRTLTFCCLQNSSVVILILLCEYNFFIFIFFLLKCPSKPWLWQWISTHNILNRQTAQRNSVMSYFTFYTWAYPSVIRQHVFSVKIVEIPLNVI